MRLTAAAALILIALLLAALWANGTLAELSWWLRGQQRAVQTALGAALGALRDAEPGAVWGLLALCLGYGFFHAAGPGHGKLVVGGAALATRATLARLVFIAGLGGLGQAAVAILLVYGTLGMLETTARSLTETAERWTEPLSHFLVAGIGAWLLWRGLRGRRAGAPSAETPHDPASCHASCGHAHGPSLASAEAAATPAATLALAAAIAARPCTGALFLLVIAWSMGLAWIGALGALAMAIGTIAFTTLVAAAAVASRELAFATGGTGRFAQALGSGLQVAVGGGLLVLGLVLASMALAT